MSKKSIDIGLSQEEALVLFDWLARFNQVGHAELFDSQAEQRALWNLEAMLEKSLAEPLASNYNQLLERARARLEDSGE